MSDMEKPSGPEGEQQLTREQVMAQRAEKKKLKEARKNKSAGGAPATGAGGDGGNKAKSKLDKPPPQGQQQGTNNKEQQKQQQKQSSTPPSKGHDKQQPQQQKQTPKETKSSNSKPATQSATTPIAPADKDLNSGVAETKEIKKSSSTEVIKPKESTPVPSSDKPSKGVEYQSSIQSIFKKSTKKLPLKQANLHFHPLFHNLGVKLRNDVVRGTNERCITLLNTVKEYVRTFEVPSGQTLKHALAADLKTNMMVLRGKCPFSIAMNNAVESLQTYLTNLEEHGDNYKIKEEIMEEIERYIEEKIEKAVEAIVLYGLEKIRSGDVIMIYSLTEALINLLEKAAQEGKAFELIALQTPDTMKDIRVLLEKLHGPISKQQVRISTVNFSNAIYRMRHCTKLIVGGHGLFTTGGVMAQTGSGQLALLASTSNKPAMFLCETYKFCDRSPLDFFTLDEYVPPDENSTTSSNFENLFGPKIKYDITPASLVTVVITDIDMLPSTSVPVVLRVQEGRVQKNHGQEAD